MKRAAAKISQLVKGKKKKAVFEPFQTHLPAVVEKSCNWLEQHGLSVDGIFRVSPVYKDVLELKKKFDTNKPVDLPPNANPHVISGVLKLWFCELEQPIMTFELYDAFIAAMVPTNPEVRHYRTVEVLRLLPPANRNVVMRLSQLLLMVDKNKSLNRMPAANLAIIFASALLRCKDANLQQLLDDSQLANNLFLSFIVNFDALFIESFKPGVLSNLRRTKPSSQDEVFFADTLLRAQTLLASALMEYEQFYDQEKQAEEAGRKKLLAEHVNQLKKVLRIPLARDYLKQYLVHELSEENLMFWLDVEKYKKAPPSAREELCMDVYNNYIAEDSVLQVNIDGDCAQVITDLINKGHFTPNIFFEAQDWVLRLMETHSFPRFLRSHQYNSLIERMAEVDELEVDAEFDEKPVEEDPPAPSDQQPATSDSSAQEDDELEQLERELQRLQEEEERREQNAAKADAEKEAEKKKTEQLAEQQRRMELLLQLETDMKREEEEAIKKQQEEALRKRQEEDEEKRRRDEEEKKWKVEQEARKREEEDRKRRELEERQKLEEERIKLEQERKAADEQMRKLEREKKEREEKAAKERQEAAKKLEEEQKRKEAELKKKLDEERKSQQEKQKFEELNRKKLEEERKRFEEEQKRKWEEQQRLLEEQEKKLKQEADRKLEEHRKKLEEEKRRFEDEQRKWLDEKKKQEDEDRKKRQEEELRRKKWEEEQQKALAERLLREREEDAKRKQQEKKRLELASAKEETRNKEKEELARKHQELLEKRRKRLEEDWQKEDTKKSSRIQPKPSGGSGYSSAIFGQDRAKLREEAIKRIEEKNKKLEEGQKQSQAVTKPFTQDEVAQRIAEWQQHIKNIVLHAKSLDTTSQAAVQTPASFVRDSFVTAVDQISKETKACISLLTEDSTKQAVIEDIKLLAHAAINFLRKVESLRPPWSTQDHAILVDLREELCRKTLYQLLGSLKKASLTLSQTPEPSNIANTTNAGVQPSLQKKVISTAPTTVRPNSTTDFAAEQRKKEYLAQLNEDTQGRTSRPASQQFTAAGTPVGQSPRKPQLTQSQQQLESSFAQIYYDDGSYYEGTVKEERCHGKGKYVFPTGNVYEGEFFEGRIHGVGTLIYAKGDRYEGEFKEDKRDGRGRYTAANGDIYIGEYKIGKRHGQGSYKMASGASYQGSYINGLPNGYGVYTFENGDRYEGNFVDDFFHGSGTYKSVNGALYSGDYVKGKKHGKGKLITAKGDVYEGDFIQDAMEGFGVYKYTNGDLFRGEFKAGKFEGPGNYTFANGQQIIGTFKNGRPVQ